MRKTIFANVVLAAPMTFALGSAPRRLVAATTPPSPIDGNLHTPRWRSAQLHSEDGSCAADLR
jgi:hypothetical protein